MRGTLPLPASRGFLLAALGLGLAGAARGQEFRTLSPIATPRPDRAPAQPFLPVNPRVVEAAVNELIAAWNTPRLRDLLGPDFYEATRLIDKLASEIPRDAILRVLAIEGITTLEQTRERRGQNRPDALISTVSVLVKSQLEYNDPVAGFQRREGLNEYILEIRGTVPR